MKLSEKGRDRLYGSHNVFYDDDIEGDVVALYELSEVWEFEPDDFEGAVVLTIPQAKELALKLKNNADFFFLQTGEFDYDTDELWQCLTDKIEQAEMSKQST